MSIPHNHTSLDSILGNEPDIRKPKQLLSTLLQKIK